MTFSPNLHKFPAILSHVSAILLNIERKKAYGGWDMSSTLFIVTFGMLSSLLVVGTVAGLLWAAAQDGKRDHSRCAQGIAGD